MTPARNLRLVETDREQAERIIAARKAAEQALAQVRAEETAFVRGYSDRAGLRVRLRSAEQVLRDVEAREGRG